VLIINRNLITPLKFLNSSISYSLSDIPPIEIYTIYLSYKFKKRLITELTNNFLKNIIINPSNYKIDEINPYIVNSRKEDRKVVFNITLIKLY
ncbi:hypothetical protein QBC45DRAFT_339075, partial [Copromyces sp. CBS 386.78]